jgi:hypothetical protein
MKIDLSNEGIINVITSAGFVTAADWDRSRLIHELKMLINRGDIDEIQIIIEESGE